MQEGVGGGRQLRAGVMNRQSVKKRSETNFQGKFGVEDGGRRTAAGGAAGEAGKSQMGEPGRRQGGRELHEKDSGQQNVSFPLHFPSE